MALQLYREMRNNGSRCEDAVSIAFRSSGVSSIGKARSLAETLRVRLRLLQTQRGFRYADVSIGDVNTIPVDVIDTFIGIQTWRRYSFRHFDRLECFPRCKLRRQVGSGRIICTGKYAVATFEDMHLHTGSI